MMAMQVKRILYPGLDLNTRCRYRFLRKYFRVGAIDTLDAGFGNGAFSYIAYKNGSRVLGVTIWKEELERTQAFFSYLDVPPEWVELRVMNIYDLGTLNRQFDQIICLETLEHITRDIEVIQMFADMLQPGGRLILCCPYALHPEHNLGRVNEPETGGHVRDGYTLESYKRLLEPRNLTIIDNVGLGSPLLCLLNRILKKIRSRIGEKFSIPLFLLIWPLTLLDYTNPSVPFSLAVIAEKQQK